MWPFDRKNPTQQAVQERGEACAYQEVVTRTAAMVRDRRARQLTAARRLNLVNVAWEDSGRFKGSAVGPNISDLTLQVQSPIPGASTFRQTLMPVIRHPNFADVTADIPLDRFYLRVGNERGRPLRRVTLREYLGDLRRFLTDGASWTGPRRSLLSPGDSHALASAQACFLPVPRGGGALFNPVLFNYQSVAGDPAVLAILATREGTSATVIDNLRDRVSDGPAWGQRLFHNQAGQRASFTGQRLSDFRAEAEAGGDAEAAAAAQVGGGLNMVLLVQVPLKLRPRPAWIDGATASGSPCKSSQFLGATRRRSDVEEAVIGHGPAEAPFVEVAGLPIERDERFPVRITVQFYKATSNGVVSGEDVDQIAAQIDRVYRDADFVGSLVTDGETGRPTEHRGPKLEPPGWWDDFWARHEANTGERRESAIARLRALTAGVEPSSEEEVRALLQRIGW